MKHTVLIRRAALGIGIALAMLLLPLPVNAGVKAKPIVIRLEARTPAEAFAPSALQIPELQEDISKLCDECSFPVSSTDEVDYGVVVEDSGLSWTFSVLEASGKLLKKMEWAGSLESGLLKTIHLMRSQQH